MLVMSMGQNVGSGGPDSSVPLHTAPRSPVPIAQHLQPSTYSPCSPGWEAELPRAQLELLHIPIARPMLPPECKAQNICGQEGMASIPHRVCQEPGRGHRAGDVLSDDFWGCGNGHNHPLATHGGLSQRHPKRGKTACVGIGTAWGRRDATRPPKGLGGPTRRWSLLLCSFPKSGGTKNCWERASKEGQAGH